MNMTKGSKLILLHKHCMYICVHAFMWVKEKWNIKLVNKNLLTVWLDTVQSDFKLNLQRTLYRLKKIKDYREQLAEHTYTHPHPYSIRSGWANISDSKVLFFQTHKSLSLVIRWPAGWPTRTFHCGVCKFSLILCGYFPQCKDMQSRSNGYSQQVRI